MIKSFGKDACWIWRQSKAYRKKIAALMGSNCLWVLSGVFQTVLEKQIIDRAVDRKIWGSAAILTALLGAGSVLLEIGCRLWQNTMTEKYGFGLRIQVFEQILHAKWEQVHQFHSEEMVTRLTSDISSVAEGMVNVTVSLTGLLIQLISAFGLLLFYDWHLAVLGVGLGGFGILISLFFGRKLKQIQRCYQQEEERYRVFLQESISKIEVIKAFEEETHRMEKLEEIRLNRLYWVKKKNRISVFASAWVGGIFTAGYLAAFLFGAFQISRNRITYGTMMAFVSLVAQIQTPVFSMGEMLRKVISIAASAERVMELDDMEQEEILQTKEQTYDNEVAVFGKQICFSYGADKQLDQVDFIIPSGSLTVVMGASGVGKTTLGRLFLGFLNPQSGRLYCCKTGEKEISGRRIRSLISYVPQGNSLFQGTIRENLRMAGRNAENETNLEEALKQAEAWEFVSRLPNGLETKIGEEGQGLSQGQAQRIAIARALLRERPIYLFDEATSALDEKTEQKIIAHLVKRSKHAACIFITHRKAVLSCAGQVIQISPKKNTYISSDNMLY